MLYMSLSDEIRQGSGATGRNGGHFLNLPYDGFSSRSQRTDEPPSEGDGMRNVLLEMATVKKLAI